MDLELNDKYVMEIYENGGLTAAAKKLGLTQPALSMSLNNLEKRLGFSIFNRKTKPISLTEEGKIYIDYLNEQIVLQKEYQKQLQDLHDSKASSIAVGGPVIYVDSILIDAVKKLKELHEDCDVTIVEDQVLSLIEETKAGKLDCFISTSNDLPEGFEYVSLKKEKRYLCIPKDWDVNSKFKKYQVKPGETGPFIDYRHLEGLEMISLMDKLPLQIEINNFCKEHGVTINSSIHVNQVATAVKLASKGLGMIIATDEVLKNGVYDDSLCFYSIPEDISQRELYAVYASNHYQSQLCKEFIKLLL